MVVETINNVTSEVAIALSLNNEIQGVVPPPGVFCKSSVLLKGMEEDPTHQ